MSVRFILGRAGTGKTRFCLDAVRDRLADDPVDGPRLILLVPEQASQQIERALLLSLSAAEGGAASHRAEVLSFQRLAFRVLESTGGSVHRALTDPARSMVLRHLMKRNAHRMGYYRRQERLGGLVERLSATIAEFIQEGIAADDLRKRRGEGDATEAGSAAKFEDLAVVYSAYLDYLGKGVLDPSQYLAAARECLSRCGWVRGAEVWVDGFASMGGEEIETLVELARLASRTSVTMLVDPAIVERPPRRTADPDALSLFGKVRETYLELVDRFERAGLSVEEALVMPSSPPRFERNPSLAIIERSWVGRPSKPAAAPPTDVELVELPSRRVEVEYVVSRIGQFVRERGYRYRDIAVIARDLGPYHDLLTAALESRRIPFFADQRRCVAHHPLIEFLRAAVALVSEDLSLGAVRQALKTGLFGLTTEQGDELENYLLAHGLAGHATWSGPDLTFALRRDWGEPRAEPGPAQTAELARVNASRRRFMEQVKRWWDFASSSEPRSGPAWSAALIDWIERLELGATLGRWAQEAEDDGRPEEAEEHRQVWRETTSFLDDFAFAFRDDRLTLSELGEILETGLASLTLGLVPASVDQVLLAAIERSRHPDIKAAFVIGFNDGLFPHRPVEDSMLNDDDRVALRGAGLRLRAPARDRVLDESMLAYIALTRPSEALIVTYASADEQGRGLHPSPYVQTLLQACPGLSVTPVADPVPQRQTWDIHSTCDLRRRLTHEFRTRPPLDRDPTSPRARWNELYDSTRQTLVDDAVSRRALSALVDAPPARLAATSAQRMHGDPLRTSVSQLETFAACPFQHFSKYVLGLREREDAAVQALDVGQVHHAVLEDFIGGLGERNVGLASLDDAQLVEDLGRSCDRVAERLPSGGVLSDARNAYILRRSASQLARILRGQRLVAKAGTARTRAAELPFGFSDRSSLPPLKIVTPKGRDVFLRGYIDRVDLAELGDELLGVVVDYKHRRDTRLDLSRAYHGLSLQLIAYLLVLAEYGTTLAGRRIRPIGGLYVSLTPKLQSVPHPEDADDRDLTFGGASRPRGLLRFDAVEAIDTTLESGASSCYTVRRTQQGKISNVDQSDAATPESFDGVLDHTRRVLGGLADGLQDGDIAVRPFRLRNFSPCEWCSMRAVCRFEWGTSEVRFLDPLRRSEVFELLHGPPAARHTSGLR